MAGSTNLNVFRLQDALDGKKVTDFNEFLDTDPEKLSSFDLEKKLPYKARLYVSARKDAEPGWIKYLRNGFPDIPSFATTIADRALMIIRVTFNRRPVHFGICFGFGRFILKPSAYIRNFGLKVALNAMYENLTRKSGIDTDFIQSLDVKTVAANTIHTRRQSNKKASFETFGVDIHRDILRSITGKPLNAEEWGSRISGSDALVLSCPTGFRDLGKKCKLIEELSLKNDYKEFFSWIDNIRVITDPKLKDELDAELLSKLKSGDVSKLEIAPPEIVDWARVKGFRYSMDKRSTHQDLDLAGFLEVLAEKDKLADLSIKQLKSGLRIEALDNKDDSLGKWSLHQCLSGELDYEDKTYILENGTYLEVDEAYRRSIDSYIASLPEYRGGFPECESDWTEDKFNENSGRCAEYLMLHKQNVRMSDRTTPIEVCDLLSQDKCFIHVKPKFSSSTLSHLFAQGHVSGMLLRSSPEFRRETVKAIEKAYRLKAASPESGAGPALAAFRTINPRSFEPKDYGVVYAIIGDWEEKNFRDRLPFFSKLTLKKCASDLETMGYRVMGCRIQKN